MSILGELKRRKVFQVAVAYLVIAWAILQVVDVVNQPLNLPSWFATVVILLLAIGFPIAILFSWAFDVSPAGVVRDGGGDNTGRGVVEDPLPGQHSVTTLGIDYGKATFWVVLILAIVLVGSLILGRSSSDLPLANLAHDTSLRRFTIELPSNMMPGNAQFSGSTNANRPFIISADGRRVVFYANPNQKAQLFSRSLDSLDVLPIPGTENATPVYALSPDGQWIAFVEDTDSLLKKVPITGGIPVVLCDPVGVVWNIAWGPRGDIVFAADNQPELRLVSSSGGLPENLTSPDPGDTHKQPNFSPDGGTLVFTIGELGATTRGTDRVAALSLETGNQKILMAGASPQVMPDGNLVYFKQNALWAVLFDADQLQVIGESVPVSGDVFYARNAHYSISSDGTLLYVFATDLVDRILVWVDQFGNEEPLDMEPRPYIAPRVSPDGDSIAAVVGAEKGADLWTYSVTRGTSARLTFDEDRETRPLWSPDGQQIVYSSKRVDDLFRVATDGTGTIQQLTDNPVYQVPTAISPDGMQILFEERGADSRSDIAIYTFGDNPATETLLQTEFSEREASLSPDGRWLTYVSNRSGQNEIYLRPFRNVNARRSQVSADGGRQPIWDSDGKRIFYWGPSNMMSVSVESEADKSIGVPNPMFVVEDFIFHSWRNFDWDARRNRFLMVKNPSQDKLRRGRVIIVQNWLDSVTARLKED